MLTLFLLGPLILLACLYPASVYSDGETVPAECIGNTAKWTYNSRGLSPCNISRALEDVCFGNLIYPDKLDPSDGAVEYAGPDGNTSNECDCSSVLYVLLSACSFCQNGAVDTWEDYSVDCRLQDTSIGSFPLPFPKDITIPAWAFVDVTVDNLWIPSKAEAIAGKSPDLTANPPPTSSSVSSSSTAASTVASPLSTTTQAASSTVSPTTHKNSQTGSIVGGVIGGLAAVGLLMLGTVLLLRHRKTASSFFSSGNSRKNMGHSSEPYTSEHLPRLYDPEDPSTYPGGKRP